MQREKDESVKQQVTQIQYLPKTQKFHKNQPTNKVYLSQTAISYQQTMKSVSEAISMQQIQEKIPYNYHTSFNPGIYSQMIRKVINSNLFQIRVYFSYFHFDVDIYFLNEKSKSKNYLKKVAKGGFGTVYQFRDQYAIKSLNFFDMSQEETIRKAIEEYCLYQIASSLEIGPKMKKLFGFDIIVYSDYIEFSMQKCSLPISLDKKEILESVKLLHKLNIIHGDIKEDNIMYSPSFGKNVLIDFNCSSVISEKVGEKTLTMFKGTRLNCSEEMEALYYSRKPDLVDLYFNDLVSLKKINEKPSSSLYLFSQQQQDPENMQQYICFIRHLNVRFLLFRDNKEQIVEYLNKYKDELKPSRKLEEFLKMEVTETNAYFVKNAHIRYAEITKLINETYKTALSLNRKQNDLGKNWKQLLQNTFKGYINLQKVCLKLDQKNQSAEDYIIFDSQQISQMYKSPIMKKLWLSSCKDIEIGEKNYLFNIEKAIDQLQNLKPTDQLINEKVSKQQLKRLYYKIIENEPCDEHLERLIDYTSKNIGLEQCDPTATAMVKIDHHFKKGKFNKYKIWRNLNKFRTNQTNFCARIISEICSVYSATHKPLLFLSSHLFYDLKSFIRNIQVLRKITIFENRIKIFEAIVFHLVRILQRTCKIKREQLDRLSQKIKASQMGEAKKIYLDNVKILGHILDKTHEEQQNSTFEEILKSQQNVQQSWELKGLSLEHSVRLDEKKSKFNQYLYNYYAVWQQISDALINPYTQVRQIRNLLKQLDHFCKWEFDQLKIICQLLHLNYNLPQLRQDLIDQLLKHWPHYYCTFQLGELDHSEQQKFCCQFNSYFFLHSRNSVLKKTKYFTKQQFYHKYIDWLNRQYPNSQYPEKVYRLLIESFLKSDMVQQSQQLMTQFDQVYSLFSAIQTRNTIRQFVSIKLFVFLPFQMFQPLEVEILLERIKVLQYFLPAINFGIYLVKIRDYPTYYNLLNSYADYYQNHEFQQVLCYSFFIIIHGSLSNDVLDQSFFSDRSLFLYHKQNILSLQNCAPSILLVNLKIMVALTGFIAKIQNIYPKLACYSYIQRCMIHIFRRIRDCPQFVRGIVRENIGHSIKTIYQASKNFHNQVSQVYHPSQFEFCIFQDLKFQQFSLIQYLPQYKFLLHPLKNCSLRSLNLYHLRNSIITNLMTGRQKSFQQICEKLNSKKKIKKEVVRYFLNKKLDRLVTNKITNGKMKTNHQGILMPMFKNFEVDYWNNTGF